MRKRIVLAEDHVGVRQQLQALLSAEYDVVATACDGQQLVEAVRETAPDLIVTDIDMPNMDGLRAAHHVLNQFPHTGVVFVTVGDEPAIIRHALSLGTVGYVLKCDAGEELLAAVASILEGRRYISATAQRVLGMA